jgi:hypothetical protein
MAADAQRTPRGAVAGTAAAGVWAAQQPLDKRVFGSDYDDVRLLGGLVADGPAAYPVGAAIHLANGALFGALYANLAPAMGGPPWLRGPLAAHMAPPPLRHGAGRARTAAEPAGAVAAAGRSRGRRLQRPRLGRAPGRHA